ncbi:MAG: response regulator transcription factor [Chitinophagales bacterium]|nr:response regulator transcription factor [Chitinophagales bacterium]
MKKIKILIVEDEFIIADQISKLLSNEGYEILGPTDSYSDTISLLSKELPDIIIADIHLHEDKEGGIKISEFISKNYNIPVIFLSGYSDYDTITKAKKTSPNTFLIKPKPLDKKQLLTTVQIATPTINTIKYKHLRLKGKEVDLKCHLLTEKEKLKYELITKVIDPKNIIYIETFNHEFKNSILFHLENEDVGFLVRYQIEEILNSLPHIFLRIHKSYVINSGKIESYKIPYYVTVKKVQLPIGQKFLQEIKSTIESR